MRTGKLRNRFKSHCSLQQRNFAKTVKIRDLDTLYCGSWIRKRHYVDRDPGRLSRSEIWICIRCTVDLPGFGTATMWIRIQEVINLHERNFCKQKFTWKMLDFYFILVNFKSISFDKLNKKFNKICTVLQFQDFPTLLANFWRFQPPGSRSFLRLRIQQISLKANPEPRQ